MGEHSGKFYDAKKMREYCDGWKELVADYARQKEISDREFLSFQETDSFKGMTADASKTFVKKGMGRMLSEVAKNQRKMRKAQEEVIELFENMVDSSQNARIEYDTLEMINNDFKELYYIFKDRADNVRKIVDCLNNEFGNYAYFEQPDSQTGIDAFIDLCGGGYDTAGYLRKCQDKLAAFDEQAKALLNGKNTMDKAKKVNSHIVYTKEALAPAPAENIKTVKVTLDPVDNSKVTANTTKKNSKDDMYSYLQRYYGFTDEEMTYLKANYPGLLSSLYGALNHSTVDADIILKRIKHELLYIGLTEEQTNYIKNLRYLRDNAAYKNIKVEDIQIIAANLFKNNYNVSFVAGMLGNVFIEGDFGNLEGVNPGTNTEYKYWNVVNKQAYTDEESGYTYTYYNDFSFRHIYDVDYKVYKKLIGPIMEEAEPLQDIIGCGSVQWTEYSRYKLLMECYEEADKLGNNDGQISYDECVLGETKCMLKELSIDGNFHSVVVDCNHDDSVSAAQTNAKIICKEYEKPSKKDEKLDERMKAAKDIYNAMKKSIGE
ncbi:MAG: hypothetical protein K5883_10465 [Pseudobutyrivibrio sp.]|nr:hypothetical protein [Pseudobutyrivibrio sp.]